MKKTLNDIATSFLLGLHLLMPRPFGYHRGFFTETYSQQTYAAFGVGAIFVCTLTERQGQQLRSADEMAFEMGWIDATQLQARAQKSGTNDYGDYLAQLSWSVR